MSEFINELRNNALTDEKKEELKKQKEKNYEIDLNQFVKKVIEEIKKNIKTNAEKGNFINNGAQNIINSHFVCKPDSYYVGRWEHGKLRKEINKIKLGFLRYETVEKYYLELTDKNKTMTFIELVKKQAEAERINITNTYLTVEGSYWYSTDELHNNNGRLEYGYDNEVGPYRVSLVNLEVDLHPIDSMGNYKEYSDKYKWNGNYHGGELRCLVMNSLPALKIVFEYSVIF